MRRTIAWIMALIMLMTVMPVGIVAESLEPVLVGSSVDELKSDADLESGDEPAGEVSQESEIKSGADEPTKTTGADETDETDVTTGADETDETDVTTGDDEETDETDVTTGADETDEIDVTTEDDETDETDVTTGDDDETDETDVTTGDDETDETDETTGNDETDETDETTEDDETDETDETTGDEETDETDVTTEDDETSETDETSGDEETDETDVTTEDDETSETDETSGDEEIDKSPDTTESIADFGIMLLSLDLDIEEETPNLSIQVDDIVIGKSFSFSWSKVDYADHYQVSVVRIGAGDVETKLADQKDVGNATSYTVPASEVIEGTARFRIYVGAAPREGQCSWEEMIKSNVVTISARKTEAESMDVTITVTDKAVVTWDPVDGTDYYLYSAINKKDNTYIYDRKNTTGTKFTISASDLEAGAKYKIWVAAYADGLADPISQFLMDETILLTECSHTLTEKTNEHKVYEHISDDEHAKYSVYDVICKTCAETIEKDHKELLDKEAHTLKEGKCDTCDYQILSITVAYQFDDEGNAIFTWNPVDSAHHYEINYRLNDVPEYDGKHNIGNVTSYQIPAARLNAGDTIKFWIVACDENGNEMTITPYTKNTVQDDEIAEVPGQKNPEELSITLSYVFNTDGSVTFSWNEVDTANLYGYDYLINGEKVNASVLFTEGTSATVPASLLQIGDVIKFWVGAYYDEENQVPILPGDDIKVMKTDYATVGAVDRVLTVTHSMDAKGNVNFSWNEVETADHFGINYRINEVPAYTGVHMLDQGVTSYQIPASEFNLGAKIKFWVAAYDAQNKEIKVNPYTTDIVQRTDYCDVPAPFDVTVEWEQDSALTGDVISAKATVSGGSGTYNYYWDVYCGDTQITHYNGGADSFQWTTDAAGDWLFIAYVKDCKTDEWVSRASSRLTVIDELHDWKTVTSTEYIIRSDELHDVVTTTYQECGDCGKKTEPVVTTETVAHEFTSKTGYRDEHPHQAYHTCRYCGAEANIKDQYKTANGKVQSPDTCCICHGHVWLTDEPQEVNGEWRVYCKNCGRYKKVEAPKAEECDHVEKRSVEDTSYSQYTESFHIKCTTTTYSCMCGKVQYSETQEKLEQHTVVNSQCSLCGYTTDPYKNTEISDQSKENLIKESESITANAFTSLAQKKESDLVHQVTSEALKIITNPIGGSIDAVAGGVFRTQEKEVLQRAIIEMLYGIEYGNTTYTELSELVDDTGKYVGEFAFNVLAEGIGHELTNVEKIMDSKADSFMYAFSVQGYSVNEIANMNLDYVSSGQIDELIETVNKYSYPEGTEQFIKQQRVIKDLEEWKQLSSDRENLSNAKTNITVAALGFKGVITVVSTIMNHKAASETVDKTLQSQNEALYTVTCDRVKKIEILTMLMESLDEDSELYDACKQVRKDIQNNLADLSSVDQRKAIYENGKAWISFGCDISLATEIGSTAAGSAVSGILATSAIGSVVSDIVTAGGITNAKNYSESLENLTFIHNALLSIDKDNMGFFESELYYTLAKKQLDYASEINMLLHSGSGFSRKDEEEKLSIDRAIVKAQRDLLNVQNKVRTEYFANNGIQFKAENGYNAGVIDSYLLSKYDLQVGNEDIPAYANIDAIGATGEIQPIRLFDWKLEKNSRYEIVAVVEKDGIEYLEVKNTKGDISYVKTVDVPNCKELLKDKYSLHIKSGSYILVYLYNNVNDLTPNSDYAFGDYEIIRAVKCKEEYYYRVRDTKGNEWYLKAKDVQNYLQQN